MKNLLELVRAFFLCLCTVLAAGCTTTTPLTWTLPDGVKTLDVNGYPMAYMESGTGGTTVAVHGAVCDYRCYNTVRQALSADARFVSLSLRHAYPDDSDAISTKRAVMDHVQDVAAFIERMNPPVSLIGHSFGGHIAAEVARTRPELVRRLVLVEAPLELIASDTRLKQTLAKRADLMEPILKAGNIDLAAATFINDSQGPGAWDRASATIKSLTRANLWPFMHYARDDSSRFGCQDLASLKMPVLLVTGENTGGQFKVLVDAQIKCLPSAHVARIPNAGRAVQAQNPAGFANAVNAFLK